MTDYKLFDTFQDAVLVIDGEGRLVYGNHAASQLFEISARRMSSGKPLEQFVTFEPNPFESYGSITQINDATQVREVAFQSNGGKEGWIQITFQPQPEFFATEEDERSRWLVYIRDVSLEKVLHDKYRAELDQKEAVIRDLRIAQAELENYSRNLEKMVEARTAELREANQLVQTILDSLSQGIVVFDKEGKCLPVFSRVSKQVLEGDPSNRMIEDVLRLSSSEKGSFQSWREAVFQQLLDFEDMIPLAPQSYAHSQSLDITLGYNLMKNPSGSIDGVVVVATDRTREMEALKEAEVEREHVKQVVQVARNKEAFRLFVSDSRKILMQMQNLDLDLPAELLTEVARQLHTIKGGAATFSFSALANACHRLEDELKPASQSEQAWRAFAKHLASQAGVLLSEFDATVQTLSEMLGLSLVVNQSSFEISAANLESWLKRLQATGSPVALQIAEEMHRQLKEKPLGGAIQHFESSLGELATSLGKKLKPLHIVGGETRAPLELVQGLLASLVHAFRNSLDHGFETPDERAMVGKSPEGQLSVSFSRAVSGVTDELTIVIKDDGRGVDASKIRGKLVSKGQAALAEASDQEVIQTILRDDFSTAETITALSGRGVGLGAIAAEARKLGGTAVVHSELGQGMELTIRVPLNGGTENKEASAA